MDKLIVAEKPSVASRIATSLGDKNLRRLSSNGVNYFEIDNADGKVFVVAAAGHLFTIAQKSKERKFPVFDVEWIESYKASESAAFTKKYLDTILEIGSNCSVFINACDYDVEGSVIGTNIIKYVINKDVNKGIGKQEVKRMLFSTTTKEDLLKSFNGLKPYDIETFEAGEARHTLDWMWGINMSRALMRSLIINGVRKVISIGRVQGPALSVLVQRENEIKAFISKPFWQIFITVKGVEFNNVKGEIFEKQNAENSFSATQDNAIVSKINRKEGKVYPYPPFDLTSLQIEASRSMRIDPSRTLAIAQSLYEKAYISYPRTSSQKLPASLELPKIINDLAQNPVYSSSANFLISKKMFKPMEGKKEDEAHPAIHPTGVLAKGLNAEEEKIYDLITCRFLACFANAASTETTRVILNSGGEEYAASGTVYTERGWMDIYKRYIDKENKEMPQFTEGASEKIDDKQLKEGKTKPPARFSKASLISLLEKRNLGTKATRAEVIDTLFKRGYADGVQIETTEFGLSVYETLHTYCPDILDADLTRQLEDDMEKITKRQKSEQEVIEEGKTIIVKLISKFTENEKEIGKELIKGLKLSNAQSALGKCIKCGEGMLVIKRSRFGKFFVACNAWPKCNATYPLPQNAKILPTDKICEKCHTPFVKVIRRGKRPFNMCLDPNCETKSAWRAKIEAKKAEKGEQQTEESKPTSTEAAQAPGAPMEIHKKIVVKPKRKKPAKEKSVKTKQKRERKSKK